MLLSHSHSSLFDPDMSQYHSILLLLSFLGLTWSSRGYIKIEVIKIGDNGTGDVEKAYGITREKALLPQIREICTDMGFSVHEGEDQMCRRNVELLVMCNDDHLFKRFEVSSGRSIVGSYAIIIKDFTNLQEWQIEAVSLSGCHSYYISISHSLNYSCSARHMFVNE